MADKYLFHGQEKKMNKKVLLVILAMTIIASNAWAAEPEWFGSLDPNGAGQSTEWFNAAMWRNPSAVPTISDKAKINLVWGNPGPVIDAVPATAADVNQLYVAESNGALPGEQTLEVTTGGVLNVKAEAVLGFGRDDVNDVNDQGKLLVTGGTVNCNQHLFVGNNPGAIGILQIDSGTVDVNQMFGLSWNGGKGYAQLNGGTLTTEEFEFEYVAGGTASMDIEGGTWIQKHFWWDKIRSLIWNGKITGYGNRANVVVNWDPILEQHTITALASPDVIVVKQGGGGDHTTIQAALNDAGLAEFDVIEVQDNATYAENLVFPNDVNYLTLQAGEGNSPTITVTGADPCTIYIRMSAVGQTIQGFTINFSGSAYNADNNSTMLISYGGASTVRDCTIVGPTIGWIRGITNVATVEDCDISNCRYGVICDLNDADSNFPSGGFTITGCDIHDNRYRGIAFVDCNAVMDDCVVSRSGDLLTAVGGNVLITDSNSTTPDGTTNVLITNSLIKEAIWGRNVNMETIGTATIEDCIIMNTLGTSTHNDEILQYRGTLNLNRCILKAGGPKGRSCVNMSSSSSGQKTAICNINHCDIYDTNAVNQWGAFTTDPCQLLTVRNSIFTGQYGLLANVADTIDSNWNDVYCDSDYGLWAEAGPNDISVDPLYIQIDDANLDTFFALQPYSPVVNADEFGSYMGSQGPMTGYEVYLADLDDDGGVDFNDFAILALDWRDSNTIPAIADANLEDFESFSATGGPGQVGTLLGPREAGKPDAWRVLNWTWSTWNIGSSELSLLTDPNDANEGSQAMRWVYDVNVTPDENEVQYTEILVVLASEVNFEAYNELRLRLKRDPNNSPDDETYMYAKFLNDIYTTGPYGLGDPTGPDKSDIANSVIGGHTLGTDPNYSDWTINFDNLEGWTAGHNNLQHVGAVMFGIRTQAEKPYGHGTGIIDVDYIRLVDRPECSGNPAGDLNDDCEVNFEDVRIFIYYWLMGK
jgi:hypothetical protein